MLHDFIPIIKKVPISEHPNGLTIIPLADAHYGSEEFDSVLWHKTIKRIYDDPDCYFILVGDLLDFGTPTSVTDIYKQTVTPRQAKEWLTEELRCIAPKCLAACGGNHERRGIKATSMDALYDVMVNLGIEDVYRQNIAFMQLKLVRNDGNKTRLWYAFAITHGAGGGQYIGSSANRVQNYGTMIDGIDCIVTGHTHRPVTFPVSKLVFDPDAKTIKQKQFTVVVASSFLDYGGYPVEKLLTPAAHTITEIRLEYSQDGRKDLRVVQ